MGQSATLYRIAQSDFPKIVINPNDFDLSSITKGYETFQKTHEGLRFVLSKYQGEEAVNLANQLFYPESTLGGSENFEAPGPDTALEMYDFEKLEQEMSNRICYNTPDIVTSISNFLNQFNLEYFASLFDYRELNKEGIYPCDIWNDSVEEDICFNLRDMSYEFTRLKDFYKIASTEGNYVLSFVG